MKHQASLVGVPLAAPSRSPPPPTAQEQSSPEATAACAARAAPAPSLKLRCVEQTLRLVPAGTATSHSDNTLHRARHHDIITVENYPSNRCQQVTQDYCREDSKSAPATSTMPCSCIWYNIWCIMVHPLAVPHRWHHEPRPSPERLLVDLPFPVFLSDLGHIFMRTEESSSEFYCFQWISWNFWEFWTKLTVINHTSNASNASKASKAQVSSSRYGSSRGSEAPGVVLRVVLRARPALRCAVSSPWALWPPTLHRKTEHGIEKW